MLNYLKESFADKKVFITGHTGFKGSWLSLILKQWNTKIFGFSLPPPTTPSLFELTNLKESIQHIEADVRDIDTLKKTILSIQPDFVFHLAAESLVLNSYEKTHETFAINTQGTVNLLEAIRSVKQDLACFVVTTDKVYDNKDCLSGYRENDALGAQDPYSTSKAMAELAARCYRKLYHMENKNVTIATARAGNVIGGGDFSPNRLMVDSALSLANRKPIVVRNPTSIRPWMHVLEPIYGYLLLAAKLKENKKRFEGEWNFGPKENDAVTCQQIVEEAIDKWGEGDWIASKKEPQENREMKTLLLNSEKALKNLDWCSKLHWTEAVSLSIEWYKNVFINQALPLELCQDQILRYENQLDEAKNLNRISHFVKTTV